VPFALLGGTALGTGRGELLEPLPSPAELHWVFATAGFGISTAAAYAELDRLRAAGATAAPALDAGRLRAALAGGDLDAIASALHNDLQSASLSLAPPLRDALAAGREAGALAALVSGSGPTGAFLCADDRHARRVAQGLRDAGACRTAVTACGPVPGAVVVA
jgi:4-diphosphocytidyl-2-C-methyl-D-erythritol kinase